MQALLLLLMSAQATTGHDDRWLSPHLQPHGLLGVVTQHTKKAKKLQVRRQNVQADVVSSWFQLSSALLCAAAAAAAPACMS
jgi:hypothetical protein